MLSGFYRVVWPLTAAFSTEDLSLIFPEEEVPLVADIVRDSSGRPSVGSLTVPSDCTGVLLQRPTNRLLVECISKLQEIGIPVAVELDDDLSALTPRHAAYSMLSADPEDMHTVHALRDACLKADVFITSTEHLLKKFMPDPVMRLSKGRVLRNRLRSDFVSCLKKDFPGERAPALPVSPRESAPLTSVNPAKDAGVRLGWPGVITTHPDDLQVLGRALPKLGLQEFRIVGPVPEEQFGGQARARRLLGGIDPVFTGSVTFADYLPTLARSLDVAVAPLETNEFNLGKSWLKPLELSAMRIPFVASDLPEYAALGAGLLAADDYRAWASQLKRLLSDPGLRTAEVERNFAIAEENTYALHTEEWKEALAGFT